MGAASMSLRHALRSGVEANHFVPFAYAALKLLFAPGHVVDALVHSDATLTELARRFPLPPGLAREIAQRRRGRSRASWHLESCPCFGHGLAIRARWRPTHHPVRRGCGRPSAGRRNVDTDSTIANCVRSWTERIRLRRSQKMSLDFSALDRRAPSLAGGGAASGAGISIPAHGVPQSWTRGLCRARRGGRPCWWRALRAWQIALKPCAGTKAKDDWVPPLRGLPLIKVDRRAGRATDQFGAWRHTA